jgi:hypothetical protein
MSTTLARPEAAIAPDEGATHAELNYLVPSGQKPVTYTFEPPPGVPRQSGRFEARRVNIANARASGARPNIDREGYALVEAPTEIEDFWDQDQVRARYYPEAERLLKTAIGAHKVFVFDHTLRRRVGPGPLRSGRGAEGAPREPVARVHVDHTERSGPRRLRDFLGDEADDWLKGRFAIVNVWRPLFGPLKDAPLALCDARSVAPQELVASDLVFRDRVGETYSATYSPDHRWSYFPRMSRDEVLLLKCYDSRKDVARFSPHTAFDDPATPPDARPRESIELRTFVYFPE